MRSDVDLDRLAELEEERRFLLRSIADLDREYAAGDVDDADHRTLRDGYVARAANVLRAIEEGRAALPPAAGRSWRRVAVWAAVTVVVAVAAGWWVAHSSGQRLAGQSATGGAPVDRTAALLTEARQLTGVDNLAALQRYQQVRELDPTNVEARTYFAFLLVTTSRQAEPATADLALRQAIDELLQVTRIEPTYPDAHCLLAVVYANVVTPPDDEGAAAEGTACLAHDPPADMRAAVESLVVRSGGDPSTVVTTTSAVTATS